MARHSDLHTIVVGAVTRRSADETVASYWIRNRRIFALGHHLNEPQLTRVRDALSEPFNHFPTDYDYVVRQLKGVDPAVLYKIFYSEVAPVCFTNIAAVLPTVWTGFDPDWLRSEIEERLAARRRNWFRRQYDRLLVRWLEYNYDYMWKEIASRL